MSAQDDLKILYEKQKILIEERNRILSSLFKSFLPSYRRRLKVIDFELDRIEIRLQDESRRTMLNLFFPDKPSNTANKLEDILNLIKKYE